ncbi:unnamed protein product [Malus baccata var. baccata]
MDSPNVEQILECFVQPHHASEESDKPFFLTPGRLVTKKSEDPALYLVYVDINNSPGAKFIYATLDMSISDILSPTDVLLVVQSFFDHDRAVNHDGHTMSLLTIQVTELVDGILIGPSMNHCLGDGTSFWHFFNIWSEIFQAQAQGETVAAGELLEHGIGWAAWKLQEAVVNHNDNVIRELIDAWLKSPAVYQVSYFDPFSIMMGSSPRFNMSGNEFGMGKAIALRSGYATKFSGKVSSYEGREEGSIDLEVCLPPEAMSALECDKEFMEAASVSQY